MIARKVIFLENIAILILFRMLPIRTTARPPARTHTRTHARTHADIFQKPCIFIPNTSENNYNMFLQQLQKLLSQSFLLEEAISMYVYAFI